MPSASHELQRPSPARPSATARYHANLVENALLDVVLEYGGVLGRSVLQLGIEPSHGVEFARSVLEAGEVEVVVATPADAETLRRRYAEDPRVRVRRCDLRRPLPRAAEGYSLITALRPFPGLHDERAIESAVDHVIHALATDGLAVFGGRFGTLEHEAARASCEDATARLGERVERLGGSVHAVRRLRWFGDRRAHALDDVLLFVRRASRDSLR